MKTMIAITIAWIVFCALAVGMAWLSNQGLLKANAELRQDNTKLKSALEELSAADKRLQDADQLLQTNCSELQQANQRLSIVARLSSDQLRSDIATFQRLRREGCR